MSEDSITQDVWTVLIFLALGIVVGLKWDFIYEKLNLLVKMVSS